ncbi:MAG: PilZ domain-containing protein [Dissulfurispiraceae bacterium]|jgi:hypothetical protein
MRFFESKINQRRDDTYDEERFWPRFKCKLTTQFSDDTGTKWECDIIDISESGFGIMTSAKLKKGKTLSIVDPMVKARVVWVRNNMAGLMIYD